MLYPKIGQPKRRMEETNIDMSPEQSIDYIWQPNQVSKTNKQLLKTLEWAKLFTNGCNFETGDYRYTKKDITSIYGRAVLACAPASFFFFSGTLRRINKFYHRRLL